MNAGARSAVALFIVMLSTLGIAWAGRASEGRRALADADAALGRMEAFEAIIAARVAAEARCPGCTAPERGFAKLEKIARDAEARGDDATAFAAWQATRAALLATAAASATSARRAHAESEVARFAHRIDEAAVASGAPPTASASEPRLRAALAESGVPSGSTFALVGLGGALFLLFAGRFARSAGARRATDLALALGGAALGAIGALLF